MKERGQVALFVMIGVLVIFGIIAGFYLRNSLTGNTVNDEKVAILRENTLDCMNNVYQNSLMFVGFQGGFYNVSNGYNNGYFNIPYYYNQGSVTAPSIEMIEEEMQNYLDDALIYCIDYESTIAESEDLGINFNRLDLMEDGYYGYEVSHSEIKSKVTINEKDVEFTTDVVLTVVNPEGNKYILDLKKNPQIIKSDLYSMHEIGMYISDSLVNDNEKICLTCVEEMASEKGLFVEFMSLKNKREEQIVIYNNATTQPFVFQFLNKYNKEIFEDEGDSPF